MSPRDTSYDLQMSGWRRPWGLVLFVCVSAMGGACARPGTPEPTRLNIVFVLIDTLRSDHLGCYGYDRATSPFIDQLAESGMLFERAFAQAPWTAPSVASIFTSRYPSELGVGAIEDEAGLRHLESYSASGLGSEPATLAEALAGAGYATMAATANVWASEWVGMLRGFESIDEEGVLAEEVVFRTGVGGATLYLSGGGHVLDLRLPREQVDGEEQGPDGDGPAPNGPQQVENQALGCWSHSSHITNFGEKCQDL